MGVLAAVRKACPVVSPMMVLDQPRARWPERPLTSTGEEHAFRTAANSPINPATDDLGILGVAYCTVLGINAFGEVFEITDSLVCPKLLSMRFRPGHDAPPLKT